MTATLYWPRKEILDDTFEFPEAQLLMDGYEEVSEAQVDMNIHRNAQSCTLITMLLLACAIGSNAQTQLRSNGEETRVSPEGKQPPSEDSSSLNVSPQSTSDNQWHFQLTPYLWIAGISGRAGIGALTVDVDSGLTSDNVHLNFGFMGTFEARRNRLVVVTDLQYSNLGTDRPTPGPLFSSAETDFKTFILDPEVGYRVAANEEKGRSLDVLGGFRYWHLRTDLNLDAGLLSARSASRSKDWVDGVVGMRVKVAVSKRVFLIGKADLGGGGSNFTYQLLGGAGINVSRRISLLGGYRHLHVDYDRDNFLFDMSLSGPILGIGFRL